LHRAKCTGHHFRVRGLTLRGAKSSDGYALTLGPRRHDSDIHRRRREFAPSYGGGKPQLVVYVCMINCFASEFPVEDEHAVVAESGPVNSARCHWVECRRVSQPPTFFHEGLRLIRPKNFL